MRSWRRAPAAAVAAAVLTAVGVGVAVAAAPVPCQGIGGGKYNCSFYAPGDGKSGGSPVQVGATTVGYLHKGTNWVLCQQVGGRVTVGKFFNNNWGWTVADNNKPGWVNAVYASGGDNDGPFGGNVPPCNGAHGTPPGGPSSEPGGQAGSGLNLPPPGGGGLPPLLTQKQIRAGNTAYGKCTASNGNVTCTNVRLVDLPLPASFAVPSSQRKVKVNAEALEAFRQAVTAIDRAGLGPRIKQFQTVNRRQCRNATTGKFIPGCLSLHSWGVAVDINPSNGNATKDGQPLAGVRKIFVALRFVWGATFSGNPDAPHFQYAKL
jgi:hypothetical protein